MSNNTMANENPSFLSDVAGMAAPALAFVIGYLRAWRDGQGWASRLIEGVLIACATFGVAPTLKYFGMPMDLAYSAAVFLGYVGVDTISEKIRAKFRKV